MSHIQFGTDGWRAVIADDFTFTNVARVAQAAADYGRLHPPAGSARRIVVGYDRRFLSDQFARHAAEVFAGNGFEVLLTDRPTPTPAVSLAVRDHQARLGVVITASHNPPHYNGLKLKGHYGGPAGPQLCQKVEALLDTNPIRRIPLAEAIRDRIVTTADVIPRHLDCVRRYVHWPTIARSGLRLAHDALYGVGADCFNLLLADTNCQLTLLNGRHDALFGGLNPEPVPANYAPTAQWLRHHPHDLCLVTDGDADRIGAMDGLGWPLSSHQIICLLLRHLYVNRMARGRVIKALNTTAMLDRMCEDYGLQLIETHVGFKSICEEMLRGGVLLGGEESGSVGFQDHIPERDGILAGLLLVEMLAVERRPLRALLRSLERRYGPHRYARLDIAFPLERRPALLEHCRLQPPPRLLGSPVERVVSFDGVKYEARNHAWLMVRGSGTEPVVRIYAEAATDEGARRLLNLGKRLLGRVPK